jgi:O-antigen/teichoic acid export membrane protein
MVFTVVITPWLLPFIFGWKYGPSIFMSQILLVAIIFQGLILILNNGLCALGQPGKTAISQGVGLVVTIALLLWLLPLYGALGAAWTSLGVYFLVTCVQIFFVKRASSLEWREIWIFSWVNLFPEFNIFNNVETCNGVITPVPKFMEDRE